MDDIITDTSVEQVRKLALQSANLAIITVSPPTNSNGLPSSVPVVFNPQDGNTVSPQTIFEHWRTHPERRKGTAKAFTLVSFSDLINRHKTEDSVVFANTKWPNPSLTAVIDYHQKDGTPAFKEHRIRYDFPLSDEFKAWAEKDGKPMSQVDFAAFIEERIADLSVADAQEQVKYESLFATKFADPSQMMMLSRGLEVHVVGQMKNAHRLSNGETEMVFVEQHVGATGDKLVVPGLFMVSVPAFVDGEHVRLPARLRYRAKEGVVVWFFQLYQWREILRDRVVGDLDDVKETTSLPTYEGEPEV